MIYTFDKQQNILRILDEDNFLTAELTFKINEATAFSFTVTPDYELTDEEKYLALPHPLDQNKFIMLRLISRTENKDNIEYMAYEYAYQELSTSGYIKDTRPSNANALTLMTKALEGSGWSVGRTTVAGTATTNFYYIDYLSAVSKVVDLLGGEIVFYVEITGNKITGRYMDYLFRQGVDTSKVFANGSNLLTVTRKKQSDSIYTAILPRGKGEQVSDGGGNEPDGYGRRIDIKDVVWSTANGNPLNKPTGSFILEDPQATAEYGQANGNARLLIQNFDDIEDPNVLIQQAYNTLIKINHPLVEYSATVSDVGTLSLGDTVLIMHSERNLSYKTRVFQVKYDLLHSENTELSLGDNLSNNSITSQINSIRTSVQTNSEQQAWTVSRLGRYSTTFGAEQPTEPKIGDVWFKSLTDGNVEIWRYNGTIWVKVITPTTGEDIAQAVDQAIIDAKAYSDQAIADNNEVVNRTILEVSQEQANLAIQAGDFDNKAKGYANAAKTEAIADADGKFAIQKQTNESFVEAIGQTNGDLTQLATRVLTAEGQITTVNDDISGLESKQLIMAGQISTEVSDRQTGDTNALTQAKNFTTSSITSYNSDIQTQFTQTESSIIAQVTSDTTTQISLLKDSYSFGTLSDGKLVSGFGGTQQGVYLKGNMITLDGDTTVTGDFYARGGNFQNLNASNITAGTLDAGNLNVINLNVQSLVGDFSTFFQTNWNGKFESTQIDAGGMTVTSPGTITKFDTTGAHFYNNSGRNATYSFGNWSDDSGHATTSTGLYLGTTGSNNAFINILGTNGAAALVLAGSEMDFGTNNNVVQGSLNAYVNVNIRERLQFKANRYVGGQPSYIEVNEINRTFNFFTGGGSGTDKDYFYFNQNVISAGTFSSTSALSKKNIKSNYDEDALSEISKTQLVNFEYKNRPGVNQISPIIDDVNDVKEYYIPQTILGQNNQFVDLYSMISMAWKAIQQLDERTKT